MKSRQVGQNHVGANNALQTRQKLFLAGVTFRFDAFCRPDS